MTPARWTQTDEANLAAAALRNRRQKTFPRLTRTGVDSMNIGPEAIDAVFDRFRHLDITTADIEGILETAAPHMLVCAWDRGNRAALGRPNPYRKDTLERQAMAKDQGHQVIPEQAVEAALRALIASRLGDHPDIYGEEFVEAAIAALEAAAPHMIQAAYYLGLEHGANQPTNPYRSRS